MNFFQGVPWSTYLWVSVPLLFVAYGYIFLRNRSNISTAPVRGKSGDYGEAIEIKESPSMISSQSVENKNPFESVLKQKAVEKKEKEIPTDESSDKSRTITIDNSRGISDELEKFIEDEKPIETEELTEEERLELERNFNQR